MQDHKRSLCHCWAYNTPVLRSSSYSVGLAKNKCPSGKKKKKSLKDSHFYSNWSEVKQEIDEHIVFTSHSLAHQRKLGKLNASMYKYNEIYFLKYNTEQYYE